MSREKLNTLNKDEKISGTISVEEEIFTPRQILYKNMVFYDKRATKLGNAVIKLIKSCDKTRIDLVVEMTKEMSKYNMLAIDCATKLAPYVHAKLASVEVKSTVEHRFVARVPTPIKNTQDWLDACGATSEPQKLEQLADYTDVPETMN